MIRSKSDITKYLNQDLKDYPSRNLFILWLKGSESYPIVRFMICLRNYEYYFNTKNKSLLSKICKHFWRFQYRHAQLKFSFYVGVNVAGPGLKLVHPGFRHLMNVGKIGSNCTILPMVLIGKRKPHTDSKIEIGNNCYIGTGVTLLTPLTIGNNVTIGAGSVVTRDIPDDSIVGGVPARVIKSNN